MSATDPAEHCFECDEHDPGCPWCVGAVNRARGSRRFCDAFIEHPSDEWGGTYCKLLAGHEGDCSPHYPATASTHPEAAGPRRRTE